MFECAIFVVFLKIIDIDCELGAYVSPHGPGITELDDQGL